MELSRRDVLNGAVAAVGAAVISSTVSEAQGQKSAGARTRPANEPFGYCLNTSTIRGNKLDLPGVIGAASKAGFQALEPWISEIDAYTTAGGTLKDLGKRIADAGLTVEGAIAFNSFLDDDDTRRTAALEKLKADMVEHDGHVGKLLDKLDQLGITDNTIVMYSTDNGAEVMGTMESRTPQYHLSASIAAITSVLRPNVTCDATISGVITAIRSSGPRMRSISFTSG